MSEEVEMYLEEAKENMEKAIDHLEAELSKLRAGKANVSMLNSVFIDYYGVKTQLAQAATIGTPDAKTITVKPWEKSILADIEKAIHAANLGFNPMNDGETIRINLPPMTEERRHELVKMVKNEAENSRVGIRSARKEANDGIKALQKDGLSEDLAKDAEAEVQDLTNSYNAKIDKHVEKKETEIMTV